MIALYKRRRSFRKAKKGVLTAGITTFPAK
jgi:hypothetical protein